MARYSIDSRRVETIVMAQREVGTNLAPPETGDMFLNGTLLYDSWMMGLASYQDHLRKASSRHEKFLGNSVLTASVVPRTNLQYGLYATPPPARDVLAYGAYIRQLQPGLIIVGKSQLNNPFWKDPCRVWVAFAVGTHDKYCTPSRGSRWVPTGKGIC